jgi:hypothetical protein
MAIGYRGAGANTSGAAALSPAQPASSADGDFQILKVQTSAQDPGAIANWTQLTFVSTGTAAAAGGCGLAVYWRFRTAANNSSPTVPDSGDHQVAQIIGYTGCAGLGATQVTNTSTNATAVTIPAITTTRANSYCVGINANSVDSATVQITTFASTGSTLSGMTTHTTTSSNTTTGTGGGVQSCHGQLASIGSSNTITATMGGSGNQVRMMLELLEATTTNKSVNVTQGQTAASKQAITKKVLLSQTSTIALIKAVGKRLGIAPSAAGAVPVVASYSVGGDTCDKPSGLAAGDVMYAYVMAYDDAVDTVPSPPSGWSIIGTTAGSSQQQSTLLRKVAGGSEPATYTFTTTNPGYQDTVILRITGADTTTPEDGVSSNGGAGLSRTGTGVTTTGANRLLLLFTSGYSRPVVTDPAGMTEVLVNDIVNDIWSESRTTAGATGDRVAVQDAEDSWTAHMVAVSPAGGSSGASMSVSVTGNFQAGGGSTTNKAINVTQAAVAAIKKAVGKRLNIGNSWTPANYGSAVKHWYDANDAATVTESGGKVTDWADKSGNGYNLTQATSAKQGTRSTANSNFNNLPTVTFPDNGGMTSSSKAALGDQAVLNDGTSVQVNGWYAASPSKPGNHILALRVTAGLDVNTGNTKTWQIDGSDVSVVADDGLSALGTSMTMIWIGRLKSGGLDSGGDLGRYFDATGTFTLANRASDWARTQDAEVAEVILISGALSDADLDYFVGYGAWKWGLTASLPGGHTYKNAPPGGGSSFSVATSQTKINGGATTNKTLNAVLSQSVSAIRSTVRNLNVTQGQAVSVLRNIGKYVSVTQTQVTARFANITKQINVVMTQSVSALRSLRHVLSLTQPQSVSVQRSLGKLVQTAQASSISVPKAITHTIFVAQTQTVAALRAVPRAFNVMQAQSASVLRTVGKRLSLIQAQVVSYQRSITKKVSVVQALAVNATRSMPRTLNVVLGQTVTALRSTPRVLNVTQGQSTSVSRSISHNVIVVTIIAVELARTIGKTVSVTWSQVPFARATKAFLRTFSIVQTQSVSVKRSTGQVIDVTQDQSASVSFIKSLLYSINITQGQAINVAKAIRKTLSVSLTNVAHSTQMKAFIRQVSVPITQAVSVARNIGKTVSVVTTNVVSRTVSIAHSVSVSVAQAAQVVRSTRKAVNVATANVAAVLAQRAALLTISNTFSQSIAITRNVGHTISINTAQTVSVIKVVPKVINIAWNSVSSTVAERIKNAVQVTIDVAQDQVVAAFTSYTKVIGVVTGQVISLRRGIGKRIRVTLGNIARAIFDKLSIGLPTPQTEQPKLLGSYDPYPQMEAVQLTAELLGNISDIELEGSEVGYPQLLGEEDEQ